MNQSYRLRCNSYLGVSLGTIERDRQAFLSHLRPQMPQVGKKGVLHSKPKASIATAGGQPFDNASPRSSESGINWVCSRLLWRPASLFHGGRELGTSALRASGTTLSEAAVQMTVFGPGCK